MGVVMLNLDRVIKHVPARLGIVRPEHRHVVDVAQFLAHPQAHAFLVGAMRLGRAIPKTPRLAFWCRGQKVSKVAGVIIGRDRLGGRLGFASRPSFAGNRATPAVGVIGNARPPTLAGEAGRVAISRQHLHKAAELGRENVHVIGRLLELP